MSTPDFSTFFSVACGPNHQPYGWQRRLAENPECQSRLISIPTGLGKTAGVVLAWLWNRMGRDEGGRMKDEWPRRLVYCLPMRTLVEQTRDEAKKWIDALFEAKLIATKPRVVVLMGGEALEGDEKDWDIHPEADTILIGTQDMLLSRALNRGYGMSRARWPMHFGLLNNDCLWVMDETQLMGVGVRTSAQLEGLRQKLGLAAPSVTWWASATLDSRLFATPDHPGIPPKISLEEADLNTESARARVHSIKRLSPLPLTLTADTAKAKAPYLEALAQQVLDKHQSGTLTLVILNRVDRARDLSATLDKLARKQPLPPRLLVHSRFRPMEREALSRAIKDPGEKILIATQAVEAGVDISARVLITELAPWSSLVQRFGRSNRKGEFNAQDGADIYWIDLTPEDEKAAAGLCLPYTPEQFATARVLLQQVGEKNDGASPATLQELHADEPLAETHILRRKDFIDLFDTTPDLSGLDIDVGRYIRDGEERDVQVFWREFPKEAKAPDDTIVAQRQELVRVAAHEFKKFAEKNKGFIWFWDTLEGRWQEFRDTYRVAPGRIFLVDTSCGGYSETLGWTGEKSKEPFRVLSPDDTLSAPASGPRDGQERDDESQTRFQSLSDHTRQVMDACRTLLDALPSALVAPWSDALLTAARWHDVGKAHPCFQRYLTEGRDIPPEYQSQLLAKSVLNPRVRPERRHFRHELASALAWLQAGTAPDSRTQNLVAWLIATHHGKIRLSLRALPGETIPRDTENHPQPDRLHARGIWDGDNIIPPVEKPIAIEGIPETFPALDLSLMQMGGTPENPSWTTRTLSLRDGPDLGPFRLAWLETLLRAADIQASILAGKTPPT